MWHRILSAALILFLFTPVVRATEEDELVVAEPDRGDKQETLNKLQKSQKLLRGKQAMLEQLDVKIEQLLAKHTSASNEAELTADQLAYISRKLDMAQLQYDQTLLSIAVISGDIEKAEATIASLRVDLEQVKGQLKNVLRALYRQEQSSLIDVLLGSVDLGTMINERRAYYELQTRALSYVGELKTRQAKLEEQVVELTAKQEQLQRVKRSQAHQQADLAEQKQFKNKFLRLKRSEQSHYAHEVAEAKQARAEIERQMFSLRNIGVELKLDDAYQAARYASSLTGVRSALLLGVVKVETNVGEWVGSGKFPDDMHPASREAFLRLTEQLGLDPNNTPISRRPTSYQGWGGAIGPAQFLPDTWERLAPRVSSLVGKPTPNPFELADALVGVGIMLADRGATDTAKEAEAVARYLAGPNWQYHLWYSTRVLAVAEEYEKSF